MGTTANFLWPYPESTDFVADGATAIENLADAIDADAVNFSRGLVAFDRNTNPNGSPGSLTTSPQTYVSVTFTAVAGRIYQCIGQLNAQTFDAAGVLLLDVEVGASAFGRAGFAAPTTTIDVIGGTVSGYFTASGSTTVTLKAYVALGASAADVQTTSNRDPSLGVMDVGPA